MSTDTPMVRFRPPSRVIEIKRWDPLRALELLGRHLGMFKDRQVHGADVSLLEVLRAIERDEDAAKAAE